MLLLVRRQNDASPDGAVPKKSAKPEVDTRDKGYHGNQYDLLSQNSVEASVMGRQNSAQPIKARNDICQKSDKSPNPVNVKKTALHLLIRNLKSS